MKNSEYWEKRIAEEVWKTYNSLEDRNKALLDMYKKACEDIQKELYILSQKIGSAEPTRSEMYKYNRLNNLNKNIKGRIKTLGEDVLSFGLNNMTDGYKTVYAEIMAALNVKDFTIPDEKLIKQITDSPWKTKFQNGESTFSQSLWKDTNKLNKCVNNVLSSGIVQGKTFTEMAIQINNEMNKGFNVAHRLVRTETMHTLNMSSLNSYKDSGVVKEVQYWAALDERTCEICGIMHGNTYKINEAPILPIHVNCRCTYIPVIKPINVNKDKPEKELEKLNSLKGPLPKRHVLTSINNNSKPKDKNTIILPGVNYIGDIERIKNGEYNKVNGNYEINGRTYGIHDGRLYPISGDGFVTLTRHEYKILIIIKTQANNPILDTILDNVGATKEEIRKVKNILSKLG